MFYNNYINTKLYMFDLDNNIFNLDTYVIVRKLKDGKLIKTKIPSKEYDSMSKDKFIFVDTKLSDKEVILKLKEAGEDKFVLDNNSFIEFIENKYLEDEIKELLNKDYNTIIHNMSLYFGTFIESLFDENGNTFIVTARGQEPDLIRKLIKLYIEKIIEIINKKGNGNEIFITKDNIVLTKSKLEAISEKQLKKIIIFPVSNQNTIDKYGLVRNAISENKLKIINMIIKDFYKSIIKLVKDKGNNNLVVYEIGFSDDNIHNIEQLEILKNTFIKLKNDFNKSFEKQNNKIKILYSLYHSKDEENSKEALVKYYFI